MTGKSIFAFGNEGDFKRTEAVVKYVERGALEHPFGRGRWPVIGNSNSIESNGECDCCPGCSCWPDAEITDCAGVPCLYDEYIIQGAFPWEGNETLLTHDTLCDYVSDSFTIVLCDITFGTFHWELTIGADPWTSVLTLVRDSSYGEDIPLVYKSEWYWNAMCSNPLSWVFDCAFGDTDNLKAVFSRFPKRICIRPNADDCPVCPQDLPDVSVDCCGEPQPQALRVYVDNTGSCGAMDGEYIDINYQGSTPLPLWSGTGTICGESVTFYLYCTGSGFLYNHSGSTCLSDSHGTSTLNAFATATCVCQACIIPTTFELISPTVSTLAPCSCCTPPTNSFKWRVIARP